MHPLSRRGCAPAWRAGPGSRCSVPRPGSRWLVEPCPGHAAAGASVEVARRAVLARLEAALAAPVSAATAVELDRIDPVLLGPRDLLRRLVLADRVAGWAAAAASAALADYVGPDPSHALAARSASPTSPTSPALTAGADVVAEAVRAVRRDLAGGDAGIAAGVAAGERQRRFEVRVARQCSDDAAGRDIAAARRLAAELRPVRDSWAAGRTTGRHAWVLAERTAGADPAVTAAVLQRLDRRWETVSANQLGRVVSAALCRLDPVGVAARARRARRHDLGVAFRALPDGLAQLIATHRVEDARAMMDRIDSDADALLAHRRGCDPCAAAVPDEIGPARAAAHTALVLAPDPDESTTTLASAGSTAEGTDPRDGSTPAGIDPLDGAADAGPDTARTGSTRRTRRQRSRRGELQVVIDLASLLGLADNPALLGGEPVPAQIARELAAACGSMRRLVTDPVTGHLLDYGTRVYLPDALKTYVAARDGTCRAPGCGQPAARCQLDHVVAFPHGPSTPGNAEMRCKRDHDTKTEHGLTIDRAHRRRHLPLAHPPRPDRRHPTAPLPPRPPTTPRTALLSGS